MTATSRFKKEQPIAHNREDCLVALVGLRKSLGSNAKGVFQRCQLRTMELASPAEACRVFETITPDAVVVDSHHTELKWASGAAVRMMRALAEGGDAKQHIPLIVLSSAGISREFRRAFLRAGALLLPADLQTYRQLAALIRRLCGLLDDCCVIGDSPESCFNAAAIGTSYRRYER